MGSQEAALGVEHSHERFQEASEANEMQQPRGVPSFYKFYVARAETDIEAIGSVGL